MKCDLIWDRVWLLLGQSGCLENCPTPFPAVVVTEHRGHTGPHLGLCKRF
ncbi:hypothetical protein ACRRTK_017963 [Alexandromys fortis]